MNLRGVYNRGMESCFNFTPRRETEKILKQVNHRMVYICKKRNAPQNIAGDTDQPFWTKLGRKAPSKVKVVVDEGSKMHEVLIGIV